MQPFLQITVQFAFFDKTYAIPVVDIILNARPAYL